MELATAGTQFLRHGGLGKALLADQQAKGGLLTKADLQQYKGCQFPAYSLFLPLI